MTPDELAAPGAHWNCEGKSKEQVSRTAMIRFDLGDAEYPIYLRTRLGLFDSIKATVVDRDGATRSRIYRENDVILASGEPVFLLELPETYAESRAVFVQVRGARHDSTVLRATLYDSDPRFDHTHLQVLIGIAVLLGLVIAPVVFDLAFFGALRSSFLLWHAALSLSFGVQVFLRSGLVVEMFEISPEAWRASMIMALGCCSAVGAMFTRSFIERDKLDPRLRKLLPLVAIWSLVFSAIHAASFEFLRPLGAAFHSYVFAPVFFAFVVVMVDAWRRGSRAVRFQLIGWGPLLLSFALQLTTYLTEAGLPTDALPVFYLGVLSETTITAIGVADRFFALRHERDAALSDAIELERLSERDPLTGLLNRRAIDARFDELHRAGYETFALLDLDHFKKINDTAGHDTGDKVLQIVARVLNEDEGTIAIRLGGEEFFLLMRGSDAEVRAERLRQILALRVARNLPELAQVVTASMGMLVAPRRALPNAQFSDVYTRSDMLLYEAKANGRNRTVSERLQAFSTRKGKERRARKAA